MVGSSAHQPGNASFVSISAIESASAIAPAIDRPSATMRGSGVPRGSQLRVSTARKHPSCSSQKRGSGGLRGVRAPHGPDRRVRRGSRKPSLAHGRAVRLYRSRFRSAGRVHDRCAALGGDDGRHCGDRQLLRGRAGRPRAGVRRGARAEHHARCLLAAFAGLNIAGARDASRFNIAITIAKLLPLFFLVAIGAARCTAPTSRGRRLPRLGRGAGVRGVDVRLFRR